MSYQVACRECGTIYEDLLPIPKIDDSLQLKCPNCKVMLFEIFGDKHIHTSYIKDMINNGIKLSKRVKEEQT